MTVVDCSVNEIVRTPVMKRFMKDTKSWFSSVCNEASLCNMITVYEHMPMIVYILCVCGYI